MIDLLKHDSDKLPEIFEEVVTQSIGYLNDINKRSTNSQYNSGSFSALPETGLGTLETIHRFNQKFEPGIIATSGPRYLGFAIGGTTPAAIAGDWLTAVYDQVPFAAQDHSGIAVKIELEAIVLLRDLLRLPDTFRGGFVSGATMANFTGLATARQWWGLQYGKDIAKDGMDDSIKILAATAHSSVVKCLSMLGIGSRNIQMIKTVSADREAVCINGLIEKIEQLNGEPFLLVSSAGTVNTVDFDDLHSVSALREKYKFWWHIDAAFGAFAVCSPGYAHLLEGWEKADSIAVDCHKWLNVPYESAVAFIHHSHQQLQVNTFQNSNAPYLGDPLVNFSYMNFLPENSRRLKALPAWFTLMAYGKTGYQSIVENCIERAFQLGDYITTSKHFELLAEIRLNTVCFTLKGSAPAERIDNILASINSSNKVFMTPTFFNGRKGIRAAFVNWRSSSEDVEIIISVLEEVVASKHSIPL
ncbi:pyridoxal-dependent decarboxylase [Flavihumibacter sp. ZG627]|uniref:pyridoxal phosphate-dependent decarboxylase family protein n=1 Tax=Flavihumibacter sp. ZG627 TaxID=1463156 RepID=UPI00057C859B|nr:pyridoxal-dependent decarboxylase [Flavihumibacter sp. ZG627]KIC89090.1 amino acid decarboxylase [Flavihumibacter sp. ZG627]